MNNLKLLLVGSASVLSMAAVSAPAFAQLAQLNASEPIVKEVEGSPTAVTSYDPATEVQTTTSTKEEVVSQFYSQQINGQAVGPYGGQQVTRNGGFAAKVAYNQTTDTVVTSTPNSTGSFTVSEPQVGATVPTSDVAVSNIAGFRFDRTAITGMYEDFVQITMSTGSVAETSTNGGIVTTGSTFYYNKTGKADFNPDTGVISNPASDSGSSSEQNADGFRAVNFDRVGETYANMNGSGIQLGRVDYTNEQSSVGSVGTILSANGLTTTGDVQASLVTANDVILDGVSLVATVTGLKDADVTLQSNIGAEAATRATADATLQSNINAEAATRLAADTALGGRITAEEAARIAAVTAEATARATADTTLQSNINAEAATRAAADTAEIAARIAADTALGGRITSEETARAAADTAIGVRIGTEETARAAADTAIGTRITTESNARIAADLAETNARIASDNALGSRITDETNARIAADDVLRDQIASSTATAIALGGNAILPDANFTLAGNMGFYNGATAVSINAAGKVGSNTYLTAAVGGGLNKQGKVGGRVGVVFGF